MRDRTIAGMSRVKSKCRESKPVKYSNFKSNQVFFFVWSFCELNRRVTVESER